MLTQGSQLSVIFPRKYTAPALTFFVGWGLKLSRSSRVLSGNGKNLEDQFALEVILILHRTDTLAFAIEIPQS